MLCTTLVSHTQRPELAILRASIVGSSDFHPADCHNAHFAPPPFKSLLNEVTPDYVMQLQRNFAQSHHRQ